MPLDQKYWVSNVPSNWNNSNNWAITSGGVPGASVPNVGSTVFFDNDGTGICNLDIPVEISNLYFQPGNLFQNGFSLRVDGTCAVSGYTILTLNTTTNFSVLQAVDATPCLLGGDCTVGTLVLTSGYFKNGADATIHLSGDIYDSSNYNNPGPNANNVPIHFYGQSSQHIYNERGAILPTLIIDKT